MKQLILKTFSDYICPFSYLLHVKIKRLKKEIPIENEWYPVLSHPEIPEEGLPLKELIPDKQLRKDAMESAINLAKQEGIDLIIPEHVSCSKMAIWMSECARIHGKFDEYHDKVYAAYFQERKDIGDDRTIPEIVKSLEIPQEDILAFCKDRKGYGKTISQRMQECKERQITKVPTMILGKLKIEGSWPYPLLRETVESALKTG